MPLPLIHYLYPSGLPKYLRQHANGDNSWALVTGATDGIGHALCHELSARGFNIVLHGRNEAKLTRVREEFETAHPQRHFRTVVRRRKLIHPRRHRPRRRASGRRAAYHPNQQRGRRGAAVF